MDDIIEDALALYEDPGRAVHREDLGGAAFVGHGWYSAVRDLARAALLLDDAHLDRVASPLRRSMAEHALALRWLLDRPEAALESLRLAQQLTVGRIQTAIAGGSWNIPDEVFDSLLNPPAGGSSEDVNLHFANLAREFGQRDLLAAWLHESATCHPSLASASRYTWTWPGAETSEVERPSGAPPSGRPQAALLLLMATTTFNEFLVGAPWTPQRAELEKRFTSLVTTISS